MRKIGLAATILILWAFPGWAGPQQSAPPKATTGPTEIKVSGDVTTPLELTAADLKALPRTKVPVENTTSKKTQVYEGVLVEDLLKKAGAPLGSHLSGPAMASYVLVEAADNYRVIFSLAELDSGFLDSNVLLADTLDGGPLAPEQGPFKLVAPHEKRPARWVKMVKSITVVQVGK
jgi:DMSO/TMAO reductase YedYZ molybdopterin-dependent catalytic subunit